MIKIHNENQYPIKIYGSYDNNGYGFLDKFVLNNKKSLYDMHIYMFFKWGIQFKYKPQEIPMMIFEENEIIFTFDDEVKKVENVILEINNYDTFNKFLNMFDDNFYILKHSNNKIKFYNKDKSDWYVGTEFEFEMDKEHDNPEDRRKLLEELEKKYSKVIFCQTEGMRRQFVEINNYPAPIEDIYRCVYIVDLIKKLGGINTWSCAIQTHVSKNAFGSDIEEAKKRINNIIWFFYNIDDFVKSNLYNAQIVDWQICPTFKELLHSKKWFNFEKVETDNLLQLIYDNKEKYDDRGLAPYFVNFPRLLDNYENEPTLEFRICGFNDISHEGVWLPLVMTEYCVNIVANLTLEEAKKLTIEDFNKYFEEKLPYLRTLGDYEC